MMNWHMGVHVGPAEETQPPPKQHGAPVTTQPEQTIIPPSSSVSPMTKAMSNSASQSTADGMWKAVQSLVAVRSRMQSETAAVNDAVQTLNSRIDDVADMRKMLQDYADKLKV